MTAMESDRRAVENDEYAAFARRIVAAFGRRASGDIDMLPLLQGLGTVVDAFVRESVTQLHEGPDAYSWGEIAQRLGTTRQAVQQRYGRPMLALVDADPVEEPVAVTAAR